MEKSRGKILIIDKYHNTLAPLIGKLEDASYEVILAIKMSEARAALFDSGLNIDCAIINVIEPMPDDIFPAISSLIHPEDNLTTPLLIYSSKLATKTSSIFYELGVFQIIEKPCSNTSLAEIIINLIELKKRSYTSKPPIDYYNILMANTPVEIAILNATYNITEFNDAFAAAHTGVKLGDNFFEVNCNTTEHESSNHPVMLAAESKRPERNNVVIVDSEHQKHYNVIATPALSETGQVTGMLVQCIDQTSQVIMEKKLRRQVQNFNRILKEQDRTTDYLISVQKDLQKKSSELEKLSITDYLTGINNRRKFNEAIKSEAIRASRYNHPLSLLLIDIDNFKSVNDTYGHPYGDTVLKSLTTVLKLSIRETDILSRYGGEEFAIILPETEYETAKIVSERIRKNIEKRRLNTINSEISVTVSIGLSTISSENIDPEQIIQLCDECLYEAKKQGKNRTESINLS